MIRSVKAITAAIAAASALTIAMPVAAMASIAKPATVLRPQTGEGCYSGAIGYGVDGQECTEVVGTGLKVTSIAGNFTAGSSSETIYIEYYGPNGYITKTGNFALSEGETTGWHTWHNPKPNANMTPGYYCTEAYKSNGSPILSDCIQVHT
jgi:hypothetical protein